MIIILKENPSEAQISNLINLVQKQGVKVSGINGVHKNILGLVGDTSKIDIELITAQDGVESVQRVQEPYKSSNRKFHPENTVIDVMGRKVGGNSIQVIAGPCSVENEDQIIETAEAVKKSGATMLRGRELHLTLSRDFTLTASNFSSKPRLLQVFRLLPKS